KESDLMSLERPRISTPLLLAVGVLLGWLLAILPRPARTARGEAGDRWGGTVVTAGPVVIRYDEKLQAALEQGAIQYLDYRGGRLLGTIPSFQQSGTSARIIDSFAERDLVADFKLDADAGPRPHFLMTTCELGAYSLGWSPLFVFETTTNQVATYRIQ